MSDLTLLLAAIVAMVLVMSPLGNFLRPPSEPIPDCEFVRLEFKDWRNRWICAPAPPQDSGR